MDFFLDPSRCIGCQACFHACAECGTHRGRSMIHLEFVDREESTQTAPVVCMHCEEPACAASCPADAIKMTPDGVVQSALQSRCIGCSNCVIACPFGVPRWFPEIDQMMKCALCYDRTSAGKRPLCATVCPTGAVFFGTRAEVEAKRREKPISAFAMGGSPVRTRVKLMMPGERPAPELDMAELMSEAKT